MIHGHPIREWAELLGPKLDIPSKYSNQPWKILFNRFHILEKILDCVSLPSYGGWCGWWGESNEYTNVWPHQKEHEQHHLSSVMSIVLKYPVSQTKNLDEEKSCIEGMSGCLLEEVNVYEQSVNHWSQLGSIHLQRFQDLNISFVKSLFCYPGCFLPADLVWDEGKVERENCPAEHPHPTVCPLLDVHTWAVLVLTLLYIFWEQTCLPNIRGWSSMPA